MHGLTKRQLEIVNFIKTFTEKKHICPSYREIMEHFGFSSLGSVYRHIHSLKKKKVLDFKEHTPRSIQLNRTSEEHAGPGLVQIPYIGHIKAGFPLETFAKVDTISIPASWITHPEDTYVLRAKGDTLQEEFILPGDFLIIEAKQEAKNGQMCLVLINSHNVLLKHYYQEGAYIRLEASNTAYKPMMVRSENLVVQGILIGLFRTHQ
ncbi:MAG: transcriptional repressor LexA [Chlamydiales bacterium]|nr:transcriptional repressor LexA [Chlamydiales bacterium]